MDRRFLIILIMLIFTVSAYADFPTYVKINLTEKAHQNVTFAEFFDLEETQHYALIEGWMNVSNPSNEAVYDIMIEMSNLDQLETNVSWYAGRYGVQTVYPDLTNDSVQYSEVIGSTPIIFKNGQDLDHDNLTDYMWVNNTHLVVDLSSEFQYKRFDFNGQSLSDGAILIDEQFANNPITLSSNGRTIGWVQISTTTSGAQELPSNAVTIIENANTDYVVVHIPELLPGNWTTFTYNATPTIQPPLNLSTEYTHTQQTKVLAGECFNVTQYAKNDFYTGLDLYGVNITMDMLGIDWNSSIFNFTFNKLRELGDWQNVYNATNMTWYWGVNDTEMINGDVYNISFSVCAPSSVPNSTTYPYLLETLHYYTPGTVTGLDLTNIKARTDLTFNFTKRIDRPTGVENEPYVMWETYPKVATSTNVTFNLSKVTMWVSSNSNPNQFTEHKERYYIDQLINHTDGWDSLADEGEMWYFNYTDGSGPTAPPPIIWMIPYYHIADFENQLNRTYWTRNGDDYYMKYIYVVNGYWLEIQKNVTNIQNNTYRINISVVNRGNGFTPKDLTVTIYDFIPEEFAVVGGEISPTFTASNTVSGAFNGTAVYWDVAPTRTIKNSSFAPIGLENSTWFATYNVTGSGDYRVQELYIVGLDPRLVDGGSSHEVIAVASSMISESMELLYVLVVMGLVAVNVLNYVMTKKKE